MAPQIVLNQAIVACHDHAPPELACPHRVLWVDPESDLVVMIGIRHPLRRPCAFSLETVTSWLASGECCISELRPRPFSLKTEDSIPKRYREMRDKAWRIIEPLVTPTSTLAIIDSALRGRLVTQRALQLRVDPNIVRRPLYRYWAHGSTRAALIPFYDLCGATGGRSERKQKSGTKKRGRRPDRVLLSGDDTLLGPVSADVRQKMEAGLTRFFKNGVSRKKAWRDTKTFYFNQGYIQHGNLTIPIEPQDHEAPSLRQFSHLIDELDADLSVTKRITTSANWNLAIRGVLGSSRREVYGPCARFEIDATLMDIYLVSVFNRAWIIGRPVLYVVVDVFSAMVVGFYLGLEGPSWEGARLALFNAFTDKVDFCKQFGIEISPETWPCRHLPRYLLGDNGELTGLASDTLPATLGIWPQNASIQRGDWKPNVEQRFRLVNIDRVDFLPGAIKSREDEVRRREYLLDACLTLPELTAILIRHFIRFNFSNYNAGRLPVDMLGDNLTDATPIAVWNWGLSNLTGIANVRSRHEVWTNLLPASTASVRRTGLYFEGRHYSNERLEREEWFARARKSGKYGHVEIRHLAYDPTAIWIRDDEKAAWEPCHLLDKDEQFRLARLEEVWDRLKLLKAAAREKENEQRTTNASVDADCEVIVKNARREAKRARHGLKRATVTRDISENRAFEKAAERVERVRQEIASRSASVPTTSNRSNVVPIRSPRKDPLDDIWEVDQ
ncbi:Mu transposase C-terminal domain-containing protein [Paraburkholderia tropica]|uniref:Mu transposase C-terminal domain-containing protein n=1 Tax=Paraburkholderia tropica TaxID=92647 RepID=UPI003F54D252